MQADKRIGESNTALSFEQALRIAADTHPSIAQRLSEQGASEYGATGARWQRWPGLSVSSSRGPLGSTLTELQLEQPLWSGGRITANINAAEARAEAARNSVAEARKVILERAINAYAEAMRLQSRLLIADTAIADFEQLRDMIDRRVESGISPKADAINVRARLQQSQSERMQMSLQLQNTRTELELLLGRRFTALVVPPPLAKLSLNMDEALDIVLDTAPELARLNAEERVAEEAIAATRSSLSPSLALRYQRVFGGGTFYATDQVFVGVTYQPGNGLSSFSAISEAESRRTGAVYAREAARLDLINRVRSLWQQADSSRRELSILNELVSSTQQVYESCLRQFPVGRRTWLELLLARRDATQAQYALADIRWSGFASQLKLELVTGQLAARDYRVIEEPSP
ncbi:MAG: TolC family protein [Oxalobacteraceae bacterium]|nr:TolC family protein [Oxalobacteraceae bacterium]